jgi:hypothetical protein
VLKLIKLGFSVAVQSGAGAAANVSDADYQAAGASIVADAAQLWATSDIVFKVRPPTLYTSVSHIDIVDCRSLFLGQSCRSPPCLLVADQGRAEHIYIAA